MRRATLPAAVIALLAAAGAGALLVHDAGGHERIAPGTRIAGVAVGGMDVDAARALVARARGAPLARDLTLSHGDRRFRLEPGALQVRFDADGLTAEALRSSRAGDPFGRALRDLLGRDTGIRLGPRVTYSRARFDAFVRHVRRAIGHPPRDADVDFTSKGRGSSARATASLSSRTGSSARSPRPWPTRKPIAPSTSRFASRAGRDARSPSCATATRAWSP